MRQPQTGLPELIITDQTGLRNLFCFRKQDFVQAFVYNKAGGSHKNFNFKFTVPRPICECANPVS
jgi:hypothetical protein